MTASSLCSYLNLTKNCSSRHGNAITKFTPHYMAGNLTAQACTELFKDTSRQASSNYCIGSDGLIAQSVDEDMRAWTSSSAWNDCRAITVEVANVDNVTGEVTSAAWNALVALAVDVCKRYGFRLNYTGDRNGSLTEHRMFAATACPGPYLHDHMQQLADEVNAQLDGKEYTYVPPATEATNSDGMRDFPQSPLIYDGYFGPLTVKQVQWCVRVNGFYTGWIDGDFGPMTKKALQSYLTGLGCYSGWIDGDFGTLSTKALQQHLRDVGTYWTDGYGWCEIDGSWGKLTTIALQRAINGNLL
jgi:peptidoglycan hydrolase-like protein with peptidoglycan-binding domain